MDNQVMADSIATADRLDTRGVTVHCRDGQWHATLWVDAPVVRVDASGDTCTGAIRAAVDTYDAMGPAGVPIIYGTVASRPYGGGDIWAVSVLATGEIIADHVCSNDTFIQYDLHDRESRQQQYRDRFPRGYEFRVVPNPLDIPGGVWDRVLARYRGIDRSGGGNE